MVITKNALDDKLFNSVDDLLGCEVRHRTFGRGVISETSETMVTVEFISGTRRFLTDTLPDFFTFENEKAGRYASLRSEEKYRERPAAAKQLEEKPKRYQMIDSYVSSTTGTDEQYDYRECDERMDDNFYIGDGDDWNE